jgi:hypothetical protein
MHREFPPKSGRMLPSQRKFISSWRAGWVCALWEGVGTFSALAFLEWPGTFFDESVAPDLIRGKFRRARVIEVIE